MERAPLRQAWAPKVLDIDFQLWCETAEPVVKNKNMKHMDRDSLLGKSRCGVCTCCTNKLVLKQGIKECVDKGDPPDTVYLDSLKLSDKVLK